MSALIETVVSHPIVKTALDRQEKEFFGQGWSHYPKAFSGTVGSENVGYYLSVYNTPNRIQVNWNLKDKGAEVGSSESGREYLIVSLTPEESKTIAALVGLNISEWLQEALSACESDTTASSMNRFGNVVDLPNFHAARAGD